MEVFSRYNSEWMSSDGGSGLLSGDRWKSRAVGPEEGNVSDYGMDGT